MWQLRACLQDAELTKALLFTKACIHVCSCFFCRWYICISNDLHGIPYGTKDYLNEAEYILLLLKRQNTAITKNSILTERSV